MRAFIHVSDNGLFVLARLFEACERLGAWPSQRLWNEMIRLPKPSGGYRLITLMDCTLRLWSRVRSSVTKQWIVAHPSADIWGLGGSRSSSDSAF
eukprot:4548163-Pyramimonas_sp.AAC.1